MLLVRDYMTEDVVTVLTRDTLYHARNLMLRHGVGRLVVVDESGLVKGVITLTDVMYSLSLPEFYYRPLVDVLVKDVMTPDPITVREDTPMREACRVMAERNIGGLPVVDESGRLVGILTRTDALRAYAENAKRLYSASQAMDAEPPKVSPYSSLRRVIEAMESKPYMKVLVVEGEELKGVITKRDVAFLEMPPKTLDKPYVKRDAVLPKGKTGAPRVYVLPIAMDIMTADVVTGSPADDLAEISETMVERRIGCVPLLDESGALVGLVTKHHVIEKMAGLTV